MSINQLNISKTAFKRALISSGISDCKVYVINIVNKRTNQRIYGYKCNKDRLKEFFGVQHIENLFDTMEEEWEWITRKGFKLEFLYEYESTPDDILSEDHIKISGDN